MDFSSLLLQDHEHLCFVNPFLPDAELAVLEQDYSQHPRDPLGFRAGSLEVFRGLQPTCVPGAFDFALPEDPRRRLQAQLSQFCRASQSCQKRARFPVVDASDERHIYVEPIRAELNA